MLRAVLVVLCGRTAYATETVRHNGESLSFVSCVDGAQVWNDRADYYISDVPDVLRGARLYQGPTRLAYNEAIEISMPDGGRAFAAFSANRDGGMPAGLRDDGWVDVAPQGLHWDYYGQPQSIEPLLSKIIAPGETYTSPKNTGSDTVMFVVLNPEPFVYVDQEMSWTDAREYCRTHHHDLASIHSASENAEVAALCPVWCFLGGSDVDQEGTWTWSDGSAWDYENWDTGQPNNLNGPEDYLNMWGAAPGSNREHGKWNDLRPEGPHTFVCRETPASSTYEIVVNGVMNEPLTVIGDAWAAGSDGFGGYMTRGGVDNYLQWEHDLGTEDFTSTMNLVVTGLHDSATSFEFKYDDEWCNFGFYGLCGCVFTGGPFFDGVTNPPGEPATYGFIDGELMTFVVQRRGDDYTISVTTSAEGEKVVLTHTKAGDIQGLGLRPWRGTIRLYSWTVTTGSSTQGTYDADDSDDDDSDDNSLVVILCVVIGALVVVIAILAMMKRRKPEKPPHGRRGPAMVEAATSPTAPPQLASIKAEALGMMSEEPIAEALPHGHVSGAEAAAMMAEGEPSPQQSAGWGRRFASWRVVEEPPPPPPPQAEFEPE